MNSGGSQATNSVSISDGSMGVFQNAWTGSADTYSEIHAVADTINIQSSGTQVSDYSRITTDVQGLNSIGTFDGIVTSNAGHSTGAGQSGHVSGQLTTLLETNGQSLIRTPQYGSQFNLNLNAGTSNGQSTLTGQIGYFASPALGLQNAIDNALAGDTVNAGPGVYNENIVVYKQLTLQGSGSGSDPGSNTEIKAVTNTPSISVRSTTPGMTPDGSVITNLRATGGTGVDIFSPFGSTISDITINSCAIAGSTLNGLTVGGAGTLSGITVSDSQITGSGTDGIAVGGAATISNIALTGNTISGSGQDGISMDAETGRGRFSGFAVNNNFISNSGRLGVNVLAGNGGTVSGVSMSGNTIAGSTGSGVNVQAIGTTSTVSDVSILRSLITNSGANGIIIGGAGTLSGITVRGSQITGSGKNGIAVGGVATFSNIAINGNAISGNAEFGVKNEITSPTIINAIGNWWGNPSGPSGGAIDPWTGAAALGSGDKVSSNVRFDPWNRV
jgi:hypothetical protein